MAEETKAVSGTRWDMKYIILGIAIVVIAVIVIAKLAFNVALYDPATYADRLRLMFRK